MNQKELIGKVVTCQGAKATIKEVFHAECYEGLWDIEFRDANGTLRHWKQEFDGGELQQEGGAE